MPRNKLSKLGRGSGGKPRKTSALEIAQEASGLKAPVKRPSDGASKGARALESGPKLGKELPMLSAEKVAVPWTEAARLRAMKELSKTFGDTVGSAFSSRSWYRHLEGWLWRRRFVSTGNDPVIPTGPEVGNDNHLLARLTAAKWSKSQIHAAMNTLAIACEKAAAAVHTQAKKAPVIEKQEGGIFRFSFGGTAVDCKRGHIEKLRALYTSATGAASNSKHFTEAAYCVLARYLASQGGVTSAGGHQAAMHKECFEALQHDFGVQMELFASPLNCYFDRYCSAFPDTDGVFGSVGTFFEWSAKVLDALPGQFSDGSYQCNPPFIPEVIFGATDRFEAMIQRANDEGKLMQFIIVMPHWKDDPAWQRVKACKFCVRRVHLKAAEHGFFEGAQHVREGLYRSSSIASDLFFLQSEAAQAKWSVTDSRLRKLKQAFLPRQCSDTQLPAGTAVVGLQRDDLELAIQSRDVLHNREVSKLDLQEKLVERKLARSKRVKRKPAKEYRDMHRQLSLNIPVQPVRTAYGGFGMARESVFIPIDNSFSEQFAEVFDDHVEGFTGAGTGKIGNKAQKRSKDEGMLWRKQLQAKILEDSKTEHRGKAHKVVKQPAKKVSVDLSAQRQAIEAYRQLKQRRAAAAQQGKKR